MTFTEVSNAENWEFVQMCYSESEIEIIKQLGLLANQMSPDLVEDALRMIAQESE